jgi:hypothetical protein
MILHALNIVMKELDKHLSDVYDSSSTSPQVGLGNIAEGIGTDQGKVPRDMLILTMVNTKEEKSLKNLPNHVRNDTTLTVSYENPPVYLNFLILITATHSDYRIALLSLSRAISFFQHKNVLTQDNVDPGSLIINIPTLAIDQLETFRLIFDLYSPTMEEVNHLWGTLGGKQYPFVLYTMRMLDLRFKAVERESCEVKEIVRNLYNKKPSGT